MGVKVSVVVPVRDPGHEADACIRSLLEQSLPPDEYEVIFADDGSAEAGARRLDRVAALRTNVRVLHLDPTGTFMRGRNVGLAAARGEYVYFLEQTDRLDREALARMYHRAVRTDADVLVGRLARGEGPRSRQFETDRDRADVLRDGLLGELTPHKLFRRAFVEDLRLRFADPGGPLAEQVFSLRAYLAAKVVAVLADRVCCHVEERPRPRQSPVAAAGELRMLLDVVDAYTEPGTQRDGVYAHWFRSVVLRPFVDPDFTASSQERIELFRTFRELALERFPERLDRLQPVHLRAVAALLRAGRLDQLMLLAGVTRGTGPRAVLREARWNDGVLSLAMETEMVGPDGAPMIFPAVEDRLFWRPPAGIDPAVLPPELADVTADLLSARLELFIRHEQSGAVHALPLTGEAMVVREGTGVRVRLLGETRFDAATVGLGRALAPGMWEVHARLHCGAYRARTRVRCGWGSPNLAGALADRPGRLVVPCWSEEGEFGLFVEPPSFADSIALVSQEVSVVPADDHVFVVMPVPYVPPSGGPPLELVLRNRTREVFAPALAEPGEPGRLPGQLAARVPVRRFPGDDVVGPGRWRPFLRVGEREVELRFGLEVRPGGRVRVCPPAALDPPAPARGSGLRRLARRFTGARSPVRPAHAGRARH
jgi:hypothetical protein